jgi:hypothetical protein
MADSRTPWLDGEVHPCMTCQQPTTYTYICEHCSELFLIELWEGGRQRGLKQ